MLCGNRKAERAPRRRRRCRPARAPARRARRARPPDARRTPGAWRSPDHRSLRSRRHRCRARHLQVPRRVRCARSRARRQTSELSRPQRAGVSDTLTALVARLGHVVAVLVAVGRLEDVHGRRRRRPAPSALHLSAQHGDAEEQRPRARGASGRRHGSRSCSGYLPRCCRAATSRATHLARKRLAANVATKRAAPS